MSRTPEGERGHHVYRDRLAPRAGTRRNHLPHRETEIRSAVGSRADYQERTKKVGALRLPGPHALPGSRGRVGFR
ncbi:hypothetical protein FRIGORI9N_400078 [Frigoribacterium sp. 9N]|nr:hypothetical protein FRIGORI9N_400078 [Frigoribacterium sp. 9N]